MLQLLTTRAEQQLQMSARSEAECLGELQAPVWWVRAEPHLVADRAAQSVALLVALEAPPQGASQAMSLAAKCTIWCAATKEQAR